MQRNESIIRSTRGDDGHMFVAKSPYKIQNFRCLYDKPHLSRFNHRLIRTGSLMSSRHIWVLLRMHEFEIIKKPRNPFLSLTRDELSFYLPS